MTGPLKRIPPYRVYRDFLPAGERAALLEWAIANEALFGAAGLGRAQKVDLTMRNSLNVRAKVAQPWRRVLRERFMAMLPEWTAAFGMAAFEVSVIEFDMIAYNDGAYYRRHSDLGPRNRHGGDPSLPGLPGDRLITAVYYFHNEPKGFEGGDLRLYPIARPGPRKAEAFADIPPEQNSLAVFPSWAPHEVLPVRCASGAFGDSRFAVNCWIRRARETPV
ncbi:2OG-Fe(II) oxygenase [Sphingomonas sp. LB-2]|uniref:2OG-Fe(II) oxygenase n=1 Tax=Sphingomonas caeni TaxID=2984949 RepID=UPI00222EF9C1|nr:2OG-Fe(II) oxygenase [Sphingomonas caeni]MCW3847643.1 2OG-Fe(II) oxygenase [Sphingomonas caeni]